MPNYPEKAKIEAAVNAYVSERLLHHRHDDHRDPRQIHGDCCARVQLGGIAPNDCDYCGVPFPCPAALVLVATRADEGA